MKNLFARMSWQKGESAFVRVLLSWRLWLVGAVVGAILGVVLVFVLPVEYETFATVIVDHNREEAWFAAPDKQLYVYYDVETRKLEAVALGDAVMERIVGAVPAVSVRDLRETGMLRLVMQDDGVWELHVTSEDEELTRAVAKAWAMGFVDEVNEAVAFEADLELLRGGYVVMRGDFLATREEVGHANTKELQAMMDENDAFFKEMVRNAEGISPYVEVVPVSVSDLAVRRMPTRPVVLVASVLLGMVGMMSVGLFVLRDED